MKTFFALGALALFHSAYALVPGPYTIGSGILDSSQVLTYVARDHSLIFSDNNHNVGQTWFFYPTHDGYFEIRNELGPQGFLPEFLGGESYELVAEGSGLFVRVDDNRIYLDLFDQSLNEQFILIEAEQ
ncbi:hypothetical protein PoHVEF18_009980 [Penicillium ochrochloron]